MALVFMMGSTATCSAGTSVIPIAGINGAVASVSWVVDTKEGYSVDELERNDSFQPIAKPIKQWLGFTGVWLRIDISKVDDSIEKEIFLQVKPAFLYELELYQSGLAPQLKGMGLAFNKHSSSIITPTFFISLRQPSTRVYVRMSGVSVHISQLRLFTRDELLITQQSDGHLNGFFFGAMLLMTLISTINWVFTREKIYGFYLFFLSSIVILFLLSNGFVSAYLFPEQPLVAIMLLKFCASCVVSSSIFFSINILNFDEHNPRLANGMRWLGWLVLISNLCIFELSWIPRLIQLNVGVHLACSVLFVLFSARQIAINPTINNSVFFSFYLSFMFLDKSTMLLNLWEGPTQFVSWPFESRKVAHLLQLLPMHFLIVMQLVKTQRLKSEAEVNTSIAKTEAKNSDLQRNELNRFLGLLGHEVRTPLAVINSAVQSLELQPGALEPERLKRHIRIRTMVQKIDRLLADTLKRESIESKGWQMQWGKCTTSDLLDVVLPEFNLERPTNSFSDSIRLPLQVSEQPGWLHISVKENLSKFECDLHLLQIATSNLLENACKYAAPGSTINLFIEQLTPINREDNASLCIRVMSLCSNLKEDDLPKIFTKYWRHDSHNHLQGSGLGLPLVLHIMQLHGGTAEAEILPDSWNCFTLKIPLLKS
jgi:signal transduction histidine kinase